MTQFVSLLKIENINLNKISIYIKDSKLAQKMNGFIEKEDMKRDGKSLVHVQALSMFLECLVMADNDGTLITDTNGNATSFFAVIPRFKHTLLPICIAQPWTYI